MCPAASFLPSGQTAQSLTLTVQTRGSFIASELKACLLTETGFDRLYLSLQVVVFSSLLASLFKKDSSSVAFPELHNGY